MKGGAVCILVGGALAELPVMGPWHAVQVALDGDFEQGMTKVVGCKFLCAHSPLSYSNIKR